MNEWTIDVDGDAIGGWIVSVHDGDNFGTYSPLAEDADLARNIARDMHQERFYPQPAAAQPVENPVIPIAEPIRPQPEPKSVAEALAGVGIERPANERT